MKSKLLHFTFTRLPPSQWKSADGNNTVDLGDDRLSGMKQVTISTSTPRTEGTVEFTGPESMEVLKEAGFAGETVIAEARDGYSAEIPRERLTGDGAILAQTMNGAPLPDYKAPFWIIVPYDRSEEMRDQAHQSWSVWQVTKLTIR
jgi:hypothetical protein